MLGIAINNEFLDLLPGTKMEMEQNNPFLQFTGEIVGDFSLPVEVRATPQNARLLEWASLLQKRVSTTGINAVIYDSGLQHSMGKIKVEKPEHNLNDTNNAKISFYYLTGVASFLQDVKNIRLNAVDFGGDRIFTGDNFVTNGSGFWGHIHSVINAPAGSYDYCFFPVINKAWKSDAGPYTDIMNNMHLVNGVPQFTHTTTDGNEAGVIVPFPNLKYVLQQAVAQAGWKLQGDILNDPDFLKVAMVNFFAVEWGFCPPWALGLVGMWPEIVINLQNHMPADITVSEFLIAVKNRFGWWYDFDKRTKTVTIKQLQSVVSGSVKEFTSKASPLLLKTVAQTERVFKIQNEFVGEYSSGQPDFTKVFFKGEVNQLADLPAASQDSRGQVYLVRAENNFYICRPDSSTQNYTWLFYSYNVYDVVSKVNFKGNLNYKTELPIADKTRLGQIYFVWENDTYYQCRQDLYSLAETYTWQFYSYKTYEANITDTITTKATCLGNEKYNSYLDFLPRMDLNGSWYDRTTGTPAWGLHLVMYAGLQPNKAGQMVPFATSGIYNSQGQQVNSWALAFECKTFAGVDVGLYAAKWKDVLTTLTSGESLEFTLTLNRNEFLQLQFSDTILIAGVKMYLTKIKPVLPFSGTLQVEAIRI